MDFFLVASSRPFNDSNCDIFLCSSRFLYLPPTPTYNDDVATFFCHIIWSGRLAFDMGYISVYTCVALTIERWFAVVKPTTYCSAKTRHAVYAVVLVWFIGPAVNCSTYFRIKYDVPEKQCTWTKSPFANEELPWIALTVQSIIPYTAMVVLYGHIYYTLKRLPRLTSNRDIQLRRITVVALLACSALIVGWVPGRVTFMLTKFGHLDANGSIHFTCVMITFLNSCVNPFLYGIYSPAFRAEYKEVFRYYYRKTVNVFQQHSQHEKAEQVQVANSVKPASRKSVSKNSVKITSEQKESVITTPNQRHEENVQNLVKYELNKGYFLGEDQAADPNTTIALKPAPSRNKVAKNMSNQFESKDL